MKATALSALVLLLAAAAVHADPPGVVERIVKGGGQVHHAGGDPAGRVDAVVLRGATDADLAGLCELRGLEQLRLADTRVTPDGLRAVGALGQVRHLIPLEEWLTLPAVQH